MAHDQNRVRAAFENIYFFLLLLLVLLPLLSFVGLVVIKLGRGVFVLVLGLGTTPHGF